MIGKHVLVPTLLLSYFSPVFSYTILVVECLKYQTEILTQSDENNERLELELWVKQTERL